MAQPITARAVSKAFGSGKGRVEALRDIDLEVNAGEFVAIVGASGCGKSTLLRLVGGLMAPSHGQVTIGGKVVTEPSPGIGIVFQTPVLLPWRTVHRTSSFPWTFNVPAKSQNELRSCWRWSASRASNTADPTSCPVVCNRG